MALASLGLDELIRLRQGWARLMMGDAPQPSPAETQALSGAETRLTEVRDFGPNPGALRMLCHVPAGLPQGAPLVIALHGCTQRAASYDRGCGWSEMAERLGFALLLPEQRRANNPNLCFNWFDPAQARRGGGEVDSIRQMIGWMVRHHALDGDRVFITGLSAGGAMASAMLASYPEVFAGGAILAGLPHGAATTVQQALEAMRNPASLPADTRAAAVRAASPHQGPWPRISVWQGEADTTVAPANAEEILKQWRALHRLPEQPGEVERGTLSTRRRWLAADGRVLLEGHSIPGMAHGVPLRPGAGEGQVGAAGPYLLDAGLSSTHAILDFWGLGTALANIPRQFRVNSQGEALEVTPRRFGSGRIIDKALRFAGLR